MVTSTLKKLADAVRGTGQETVQPGFLRPIDTDRIARDLKLDRMAAERGASELPDSGSQVLDGVEQTVTQKIESEWTWQGGELINQLRAYASRLLQYSIKAEFERLQLKGNDALARLRNANIQAEGELGPLREDYVEARDELARFREKHGLKRPARRRSKPWTTIGVMIVLIGLESALNGAFFAEGSEFGLLGGIGTAVGISVVNVLFAFGLGAMPARWLNHRNLLIKFTGLVLAVGGIAGIVLVQGFAAHFREAMAAVGEDRAMSVALETLIGSPLQITNISTFYLFGLGLIFAITAFGKGVTIDDPYPRYGSTYRRAADARESYSDVHGELFDDLEDVKTDTVAAIDYGIGRIPLFPQSAASIRAQRAALVETFRGYESAVEAAGNQLLARYRDGNHRGRSTPIPPHFAQRWALPRSYLDSAEVRTLTADVPESALDVDGPLAELRELSQRVLTEYEALLTHYPHPTQMP